MASSFITNSFYQIRLGGSIVTTTGNARIVVGGNVGMITSDSGAFASSANLFATGASGIAYTNIISGILAQQISTNAGGVSSLNGISGAITFIGTGNGVGSQINNINILTGAGGKLIISGSGIAQQNDLINSGNNLYSLITGFSGQNNLNSVNFSVIVPTGSGSLSITFPFVFTTIPQVDPTFVVSGLNPFSYGVWPNSITTTGYLALFSDIVTESGNSVYTQVHI